MERLDKKIIASGLGVLGLVGVGSSIVNADQVKNAVDKAVSSVAEATGLAQSNEVSLSKANLTIPKDKVLHVNTPAETKAAQTNTKKKATTYRVKAGDSLWSIAQDHKVSVDALVANNNNSDLISAGQVLTLPTDQPATQNATSAAPEVVETASTVGSSDSTIDTNAGSTEIDSANETDGTEANADSDQAISMVTSTASAAPVTQNVSTSSAVAPTSVASEATPTTPVTATESSDDTDVVTTGTSSSANIPDASTVSESTTSSVVSEAGQDSTASAAQSSSASASSSASQSEQSESVAPAANQNVTTASAAIVSLAKQLATQNIPYVWAGSTPQTGFDCSGLVSYVFQKAAGISLPHSSVLQESYTKTKLVSQAQPGDLLFWGTKGASYHVAIYIGGNQYVAAPQPGMNVRVETISTNFMPSFAGSIQ